MFRLQCERVIFGNKLSVNWLNPGLGLSGFEPLGSGWVKCFIWITAPLNRKNVIEKKREAYVRLWKGRCDRSMKQRQRGFSLPKHKGVKATSTLPRLSARDDLHIESWWKLPLGLQMVFSLLQACQEVPDWLESCAESAIGSGYGPAGGRFASRDRREPGVSSVRGFTCVYYARVRSRSFYPSDRSVAIRITSPGSHFTEYHRGSSVQYRSWYLTINRRARTGFVSRHWLMTHEKKLSGSQGNQNAPTSSLAVAQPIRMVHWWQTTSGDFTENPYSQLCSCFFFSVFYPSFTPFFCVLPLFYPTFLGFTPLSPLFSVFCPSFTPLFCVLPLFHPFFLCFAPLLPHFSGFYPSFTPLFCVLPLFYPTFLCFTPLSPLFSVFCPSFTALFWVLPLSFSFQHFYTF